MLLKYKYYTRAKLQLAKFTPDMKAQQQIDIKKLGIFVYSFYSRVGLLDFNNKTRALSSGNVGPNYVIQRTRKSKHP